MSVDQILAIWFPFGILVSILVMVYSNKKYEEYQREKDQ